MMKTRGKILREPSHGPGIVMIEGQQFRFESGVWQSEASPKPGVVVEVHLDRNLQVIGLHAVAEDRMAGEAENDVYPHSRTEGKNDGLIKRLLRRIGR